MSRPFSRLDLACVAALLALASGPAAAQYKVVGPDGRVTYTDRPPSDGAFKVQPMGAQRAEAAPEPAAGPVLPADLQRLSERYPVVLFTTSPCQPCDSGRQMLKDRGIPYTERLITTEDDVAALERTVGGKTLPALTVGGQALRGYSVNDWASYLDAAGYPRESRLPSGWTPPPPSPLVARATVPRAAERPGRSLAAPEPAPDAEAPGIRF